MKKTNEKGITLTSLLITIIVLLVITVISIGTYIHIISKIEVYKRSYLLAQDKESLAIEIQRIKLDNNGIFTLENLDININNLTGWTGSNGEYTSPNGFIFKVIEPSGEITLVDSENTPQPPEEIDPPVQISHLVTFSIAPSDAEIKITETTTGLETIEHSADEDGKFSTQILEGSKIDITVTKKGFKDVIKSYTITDKIDETITLEPIEYTLTLSTNVSGAQISLVNITHPNLSASINDTYATINAYSGDEIEYNVTKKYYRHSDGTQNSAGHTTVEYDNQTLTMNLKENETSQTINYSNYKGLKSETTSTINLVPDAMLKSITGTIDYNIKSSVYTWFDHSVYHQITAVGSQSKNLWDRELYTKVSKDTTDSQNISINENIICDKINIRFYKFRKHSDAAEKIGADGYSNDNKCYINLMSGNVNVTYLVP